MLKNFVIERQEERMREKEREQLCNGMRVALHRHQHIERERERGESVAKSVVGV